VNVQASSIKRLTKITLSYSKVEDRIRMDGRSRDDTVSLWITRRLCRELVKIVVAYLSKPEINNAEVARAAVSPQHLSAVQEFLHQKAKSDKIKAPPVMPAAPTAMLVSSVKVRASTKCVQISFSVGSSSMAALVMTPKETRQWLDILYEQYLVAEWSLDVWPHWMSSLSSNDGHNPHIRGKMH